MASSVLGIAALLIGVLGAVTALSMILLVLWQAPKHRDNQLLALYMATVFVWATAIVLFRLSDGVQVFFSIASYATYANGFTLFVLISHTLGLWNQGWVRAVLVLGAIVVVVFAPLSIIVGRVYSDLTLTASGSRYALHRAGWIGIAGTFSYFISAIALLWHFRHEKGRSLLLATLVTPIGLLALAVPLLNQLHVPMVCAVISSIMFTRAILRENLFNPMVELNRVLTASEAHYRKLAEELSRKEKLYQALASNLPEAAVVLFGDRLQILLAEGQLPELAAVFEGQQLEGALLTDVLPPEINRALAPHLQAVFSGQQAKLSQVLAGRVYELNIAPVRDERGTAFTGMIVVRDMTDLKEAEQQALELALEKERVLILRQFVSDATHDLMTPLTGMKMSIHLLKRQLADESAETRVRELEHHAGRLVTLVTDMLDIARLDEKVVLKKAAYDLNALAAEVVKAHLPAAAERGQTLRFEPGDVGKIPMDAEKLERALANIVMNAIVYTPSGGSIDVSTTCCDSYCTIEVRDTGMGIAPDDLPRIFERFFRADRARNAQTGGFGLGLAISRRIVELHGGTIEVESEPGKGSTFRILLRAQTTAETLLSPRQAQS